MRSALAACLLVAAVAFAGCTAQVDSARSQLDDVKKGLDEAKAALDSARQEATEAKDRLDRVRSLDVLREERVTLVLEAVIQRDILRFEVLNATRSNGAELPLANLTRLPLLSIESAEANGTAVLCDPLTCQVFVPSGASVLAFFQDDDSHQYVLQNAPCGEASCAVATLTLQGAEVLATTDAGDATD